jgi:hypothetical protein
MTADNQGVISYAANGVTLGGDTWDPMAKQQPVGKVSLVQIPDGTANTLAFAERFARCVEVRKRADGQAAEIDYVRAWSEDSKGRTPWSPAVWKHDVAPQFGAAMKVDPDNAQGKTPCNPEGFQAFGKSGLVIALFDGSTRIVTPRITPQTWSALMQPADGMVLGPDF